MNTVLLFNAEHRITLSLCRAFGRAGYRVLLASEHALARSFFSRHCAAHCCYRPDDLQSLIAFIYQEQPFLIIPILEDSYEVAYTLRKKGVTVPMPLPAYELFTTMRDKQKTMHFLTTHNIPIPYTVSIDEAFRDPTRLHSHTNKFLIKPRVASSGRGIVLFENHTAVTDAYEHYQRNSARAPRRFSGCDVAQPIVQEYFEGDNYSFNMIFDTGELRMQQLVHHIRYFPSDFGSPIRSRTEKPDDVLFRRLIELFQSVHWHGSIHCDLLRDRQGRWVVNEVNPRFWGTMENTVKSGIDIVRILVNFANRDERESVIPAADVRYEYRYLWLGEIAYMIKAKHKARALRDICARNNREVHYGFAVDDILPHLVHLGRCIVLHEVI